MNRFLYIFLNAHAQIEKHHLVSNVELKTFYVSQPIWVFESSFPKLT